MRSIEENNGVEFVSQEQEEMEYEWFRVDPDKEYMRKEAEEEAKKEYLWDLEEAQREWERDMEAGIVYPPVKTVESEPPSDLPF